VTAKKSCAERFDKPKGTLGILTISFKFKKKRYSQRKKQKLWDIHSATESWSAHKKLMKIFDMCLFFAFKRLELVALNFG